jgi:hypothetical protein
MKRSEMIDKITKVLDKWAILYGDRLMAETILDLLEKEGMKPPITKKCPVLLTDDHVWEEECNQ